METRRSKRTRCCPKVKLPQTRQCGEHAGCEQRWGLGPSNKHPCLSWCAFHQLRVEQVSQPLGYGRPSLVTRCLYSSLTAPQVSGPTEVKAAVSGHLCQAGINPKFLSQPCACLKPALTTWALLFNRATGVGRVGVVGWSGAVVKWAIKTPQSLWTVGTKPPSPGACFNQTHS